MMAKAIIFYRKALAIYSVASEEKNNYTAHLVQYKGDQKNAPPETIRFSKQGRHCSGSIDNQDLMDDICDAVHV